MFRHFLRKGGWGALLFLLIASIFGGLGLRERAMARALDDHGVAAVASIEGMRTEQHVRRTKNGTTTETDHLVTYAFAAPTEPGGSPRPQRIVHEVPAHIYDDLHVGQRVTIRYLPERPGRIDYFPGESRENALFMWVFTATFLLGTAVAGSVALRQAGRAQRLQQRGIMVRGRLRSVASRKSGLSLHVQFTDDAGTPRGAILNVRKNSPLAGAAEGAEIWLRYDPLEPTNVELADDAQRTPGATPIPAFQSL